MKVYIVAQKQNILTVILKFQCNGDQAGCYQDFTLNIEKLNKCIKD